MGNSKFCPHCGAPLEDNATFCGSCGQQLQSAMSADVNQQSPMQSAGSRRVKDEGFRENFFKTEGRLNRLRYFKRVLVIDISIAILSAILEGIAGVGSSVEYLVTVINIIAQQVLALSLVLYGVSTFIESTGEAYDASSPWFISLIAMSLLWCVYNVYFLFAEGNKGSNSYGPDPLER